jgi:uncharacterized protein
LWGQAVGKSFVASNWILLYKTNQDGISIIGTEKRGRNMKEFVAYIVKNLVDHPDKVRINEVGGTQTLIIELAVEKEDIGKIIGKGGKTINAIRTLLMSVASRNGIRVSLEIIEEGKPRAEVHA